MQATRASATHAPPPAAGREALGGPHALQLRTTAYRRNLVVRFPSPPGGDTPER